MKHVTQSPTDPDFVQNPYDFYDQARDQGPLVWWDEYDMPAAFSHGAVNALFRDPRLGRAPIAPPERPDHLKHFYAIDDNSMLELEAPRHTRLRKLVLRAFTTRRIGKLAPEIIQLAHELIDAFPSGEFDFISAFGTHYPAIIIARLLGVPDSIAPQLVAWSNDMVAIYQARRDRAVEEAADAAAQEFADWMRTHVEARRATPGDDLITHLIAAEEDGSRLTPDEMIATCVLLLNAGHEATVHTLGNGIKSMLTHGFDPRALTEESISGTVEEVLRFDPPLHMFTRYVYENVEVGSQVLEAGSQVALMIGAASRDPAQFEEPHKFDPFRLEKSHMAFGAGRHFCLGASLARMELATALSVLFERMPNLALAEAPEYANLYHFHGLERLVLKSG